MPKKKAARKPPRKAARKRPHPRPEAGHTIEKGFEHFSEEIEKLGGRLEHNIDKEGDKASAWFQSTFGVVGPLLSSIFGIMILALLIWALSLVNIPIGSGLLNNIYYFLMAHVGWFFLIFLFFSYMSYVSKAFPKGYRPLSPITAAAGITVCFWIAANAISIANLSLGIAALYSLSLFLERSLLSMFWLFLLLGYLVLLINMAMGKYREPGSRTKTAAQKAMASKAVAAKACIRTKRLYRSGNDRILGGVCGGIAEYLGVDPVIIRLLWVIGTFAAWGTGILLYIVMWIIVPRNPKHKWD